MNIFKQLSNLLFRSTTKSIDKDVAENVVDEKVDKVAYFNKVAPKLFGPPLQELGYALKNIENFNYSGILWSTHHFYENEKLNLTVDIRQPHIILTMAFQYFL